MNKKTLGKFIKKRREGLNISQTKMAQILGFKTCQFISNIERGVSNIPSDRVTDFANALEIDIKDLIKLISDTKKDDMLKKNKFSLAHDEDDEFINKFVLNFKTLNKQEKEALKLVILKFF